MRIIALLLILICISSCIKAYRLIDQKDKCYWKNTNNTDSYLLFIDKNEGIWFEGRMIINNSDTLFLKGFEKGNNHPTYYKSNLSDTIAIGPIFIWAQGLQADTVYVQNKSDNLGKIPAQMLLIKNIK